MPGKINHLPRIVIITLTCFLAVYLPLRLLPYPELENYRNRSYGYAVLDKSGKPIRIFPAADGVKREWTSLKEIPPGVIRILIRAEDRRFYLHCGVDAASVAAASWRNLRAGRAVSGASTITMQLARLVKPHKPGLRGKCTEVFDALRLEARLSKKEILELWINGIPFGSNMEGIGAASRARFGREAARLDEARTVLLSVIPRRPSLYDPAINPRAAIDAALLLSKSCRLNLDEASLEAAAAETAPDTLTEAKSPFYAPQFTDRVAAITSAAGGPRRNPVHSTLDLNLQLYARQRLMSELEALDKNRVTNGAILAIDNTCGNVIIYAASVSWFDDSAGSRMDGVRIRNQPGSCLKPFLYALALEKGFSPNTILPDIPSVFGSSEAYSPANFNRRFNGPVRFRLALASSLNVPAVYLIERLGVSNFEDWLSALGFDSVESSRGGHGAGLALGNAEVSLEELVRAFATFPRGGKSIELRLTTDEMPSENGLLLLQPKQVMSPYSAWVITDILSDRASRFVGFGPAPSLATPFPSMFKTGTANQFQHIWALGATAHYTVGVWMGNFSGETVIGRTGSSIPARIASDLLKALEPETEKTEYSAIAFPLMPENAHECTICSLSGMAATSACPGSVQEWLPDDKIPIPCTWHRLSSMPEEAGASTLYPPEYQAWLTEHFRQGRTDRGMYNQDSAGGGQIRFPVSGAVFYIDPSLPPEAQAIRVETSGFSPGALVYADDLLQGNLNRAGIFALPLVRGAMRITVEDEAASDEVRILVR